MTLKQTIRGWVKSGCGCPVAAKVENWGCEGCPRHVVVISFYGHGDETKFHGEHNDANAANRSRNALNAVIAKLTDDVTAELQQAA